MKKLLWKTVWQTAAAIGFLLAVWLFAYFAVGNELLIPPLSDSLLEGGKLLRKAAFWQGLTGTASRALIAFAISFLIALFFAVLAYMVPSFARIIAPIVSALRSLPVLAILLILLSVFQAGAAPVAVAFLSLFPMLYAGILAALCGIDKQLLEVARVYGTPAKDRIFKVYLPLSAPYILREMGAALSFSVKLVVSAEVLAQTAKSLGGMMQEAKVYAEIPQLFALVCVSFLVGLLLELILSAIAVTVENKIK